MAPKVLHLFRKPEHGNPMIAVSTLEAESGKGLIQDSSYGRSKRQVLLIDAETLHQFELNPGDLRENIVLEGFAQNSLPRSGYIAIGQVVLELVGDCAPCDFLDTLRQGLKEAIIGRRGVLARVYQGGTLRLGDPVTVLDDNVQAVK